MKLWTGSYIFKKKKIEKNVVEQNKFSKKVLTLMSNVNRLFPIKEYLAIVKKRLRLYLKTKVS